jgi:hypothetical protein
VDTLLGGGSSFSAGGPGKGMYSRLYREVLNSFAWAETANAYSVQLYGAGLLGVGDLPAVGLRVFPAYLRVCRGLQRAFDHRLKTGTGRLDWC